MSELNHMHENISGIYNYCDRWCEKCDYTNRCLLFKKEAERNIKHILKDEDPMDPEVFSKDIAESFEEAFYMLADKMESDGDDSDFDEYVQDELDDFIEELNDEDSENTFIYGLHEDTAELLAKTEKLFKDFYDFYNELKINYPEELENTEFYKPLHNSLDILGWYTPQIHVKTRMIVFSKKKFERQLTELSREFEEEIFNVNCRIAFTGIEKCIISLDELYILISTDQQKILSLQILLSEIKQLFIKEFSEALKYKRPYFD